jgi:hypothetical protein
MQTNSAIASYDVNTSNKNKTTKHLVKKVKLSLQQAVKAHRVVRRQGSHIFSRQSAHRWR